MSNDSKATAGLLFASLLGAVVVALAPSCLTLRDDAEESEQRPCSQCHGNPDREGNELLASAPPFDLKGNSDEAYPGVGAHLVHLVASDTHAGIECTECHRVPRAASDVGHFDSESPAELHFGELAAMGDRNPRYDAVARRCSDTYCHGSRSSTWTRPSSSEEACGTCHGLPPALPHPQHRDCSLCHAETIGASGTFVAKDRHVDGRVDVDEPGCNDCHGDEQSAAPPRALDGSEDRRQPGVGAHRAHLSSGLGRSLACEECHQVPETISAPPHPDGAGVEVSLSGVAQTNDRVAVFESDTLRCSDTWCHGPRAGSPSPRWTETWTTSSTAATIESCAQCHGMPPAEPHPQMENCAACHGDVVALDSTAMSNTPRVRIAVRERHVDGVVDVATPDGCTSCHGDPDAETALVAAAPPIDTWGRRTSTSSGVGAHTAHLVPNGRSRPLACEECHQLPDATLALGHIDTLLPAEVTLRGVAQAFEATPRYENGSCLESYCHGGSFIGMRPSGGVLTEPSWTVVDATARQCNACHGMPPPLPHPQTETPCSECHHNIDEELVFTRPELHVDGVVTFFIVD